MTRCSAPDRRALRFASTAHTQPILATAKGLLTTAMHMIERQGLTLVGVAVVNLDQARPGRSAVGRVAFPPKGDAGVVPDSQSSRGLRLD